MCPTCLQSFAKEKFNRVPRANQVHLLQYPAYATEKCGKFGMQSVYFLGTRYESISTTRLGQGRSLLASFGESSMVLH